MVRDPYREGGQAAVGQASATAALRTCPEGLKPVEAIDTRGEPSPVGGPCVGTDRSCKERGVFDSGGE